MRNGQIKAAVIAGILAVGLLGSMAQVKVTRGWNIGFFSDGSATAPSITFGSDPASGFYKSGSGLTGYAASGTQRLQFGNNLDILSASGALRIGTGAIVLIANTAPTISSGFGTSPSIVSSNGSASFRVNVGTGGVATSGVVGLPTASNGWNCTVQDITNNTATRMSASTTNTATITAAAAWAASDILLLQCMGF